MSLYVDIEKRLGNFFLKTKFEMQDEVFALLGASGCGKSMTLKCIAGIEKPDKGTIILNGITLFDSDKKINLPPQKRNVGYLFQQYALFPNMSVEANIGCGVKDKKRKKEIVASYIKAMNLQGLEKLKPHQLSGGQQQRVALARILVNEPELLLLDEPFSALDTHLRSQLERDLYTMIHQLNKNVIIVSHDCKETYRLCDTICIMEDGQLIESGYKQNIFEHPKTRTSASLIGCQNISKIEKINDQQYNAKDWGISLTIPHMKEEILYVGMHAHHFQIVDKQCINSVLCHVVESIENPFSYTLLLQPQALSTQKIYVEIAKTKWQNHHTECYLYVPTEAILCLEE